MAGIRFKDVVVSSESLIGGEGRGLELVLLCSQITRVMATAVSLGSAETALRTVIDFARERRLYGETVFNLPYPRRAVVRAFIDLLVSDCLLLSASRGLHVLPGQAGVFAASLKSLVPTLLERAVWELSEVLGARAFLREGHRWNIFQKVLRDISVVRLAHFGTTVSRSHLAAQLLALARRRRAETDPKNLDAVFSRLFGLRHELPRFEPDKLELSSRGRDDLIRGLPHCLERLRGEGGPTAAALRLEVLVAHLRAVDERVEALWRKSPKNFGRSPQLFDLASTYSLLHAAAACSQLWLHNRGCVGSFFDRGDWLILALDRLLSKLGLSHTLAPDDEEDARVERVAAEALRRHREEQALTLLPFPLYGRTAA